jgi:hypothetical protein
MDIISHEVRIAHSVPFKTGHLVLQRHSAQPNHGTRPVLQRDSDPRQLQAAIVVLAEGDQEVVPVLRRIPIPVFRRVAVTNNTNAVEYRCPSAEDVLTLDLGSFSHAVEGLPTRAVKAWVNDG